MPKTNLRKNHWPKNSDTRFFINFLILVESRFSPKKFEKLPTGESNSIWNIEKYSCTFPAMISEWRRKWSENSPTDPNFPFGFVQLASFRTDYSGVEFPVVRWHQTADVGIVPNDIMQVSPIHFKQIRWNNCSTNWNGAHSSKGVGMIILANLIKSMYVINNSIYSCNIVNQNHCDTRVLNYHFLWQS